MSEITETITVKDGQAAVKTVAMSGSLQPAASATDVITVVKTSNGDHAAVKVVNLGGGDYDAEIEALNNAVSVLSTSVDLTTEIGDTTTVLLDELTAMDIDGRPSYKEPGATVYAENGAVGIIDTVDAANQTAVVKTVQFASGGGGAGGDYLPLSGGTMTGDIVFSDWRSNSSLMFSPDGENTKVTIGCDILGTLSIGLGNEIGSSNNNGDVFFGTHGGLSATKLPLGDTLYPWKLAYIQKLNNGADLIVPTEGGTLARTEDIDDKVGDISTALTAILGE